MQCSALTARGTRCQRTSRTVHAVGHAGRVCQQHRASFIPFTSDPAVSVDPRVAMRAAAVLEEWR